MTGDGGLGGGVPGLRPRRAPGGRIWLISFTDFVCMTLAFFVMLYGMTDPNTQRVQALRTALGLPVPPPGNANLDRGQAADLGYLARVLETQLAADPALAGITLGRDGDQLVATLPTQVLFTPGSADISDGGRAVLFALGGLIANLRNAVDVVGHADPMPVAAGAGPYASNWELALARGRAVAAALRQAGYAPAITVRGQADPYEGATGTADDQDRRARRRVDVVIRTHGVGR